MNDEQFEERVRASLSRLDLPAAPEPLIERAQRITSNETPTRSSKLGLVLGLATILMVMVVGSMLLASGASPSPDLSTSPSRSVSASETASPVESETPETTSQPSTAAPAASPQEALPSAPSVAPAPHNDLALAGRRGVPGILTCGSLWFPFEALDAPTGAEDLPGPEYDALREQIRINVGEGDPTLGLDPTAREVMRTDGRVGFLFERADPGPWSESGGGPFIYVHFDLGAAGWEWSGAGDCQPQAWLPPGYRQATWSLDPRHSAPTPSTRALHLLVMEHACANGRDATGRIGPAYVLYDKYEVHIEVIVQEIPGGADCPGHPPTRARLSLPEPIGDRAPHDVNWHLLNPGTGG